MDLPHSDACFVRAYPAATAEAWMDGHVQAFAFFGGVPQSVLYDNDRCLVSKILPDGIRLDDLHAAVKKALKLGAVGFDAVKHLVLCQVEKRPPRPDLDLYPYCRG